MGWVADVSSMKVGFAVPTICFVFVALYGMFWKRLERRDAGDDSSDEPVTIRPVH
jgi:FHS family L-fucose permease-like MFS transporter